MDNKEKKNPARIGGGEEEPGAGGGVLWAVGPWAVGDEAGEGVQFAGVDAGEGVVGGAIVVGGDGEAVGEEAEVETIHCTKTAMSLLWLFALSEQSVLLFNEV
ncbi:hypothetical protein PanWU01x14_239940 [Parasponia andersonii]|uniref:Uncharacterized protein n=1 Tax=Parasponia andersonii TaxID=3476 RepID=A0A2P5BH43_PARAD|nr:hypothetical protein PanWU01x14_239940 [Parasponia andersonii]